MLEPGGGRVTTDANIPLLEVRDLKKYYPIAGGWLGGAARQVRAVDGISFRLERGRTLGIVGESGCGKSTAAKTIMRLLEPTAGQVLLDGLDITAMSKAAFRPHRKDVQIVFQDPYASLNPRMTAGDIIAEPLRIYSGRGILALSRQEIDERVEQLMERVGLSRFFKNRFPHEFSGGQRQGIRPAQS